jgi:hypothetical protein
MDLFQKHHDFMDNVFYPADFSVTFTWRVVFGCQAQIKGNEVF